MLIRIAALIAAAQAVPLDAASLQDAQAAYGTYEVTRAEMLYRDVVADPAASARDRAAANRELARIAWLVDADAAGAKARLEASLVRDPAPCAAAHLLARIVNDQAARWTDGLMRLERRCAELEPGIALERIRHLEHASRNAKGAERMRRAHRALKALRALPQSAQDSMLGASLTLGLGVLASNPDAALAGWRAYFWLPPAQAAPQALGPDHDRVERIIKEGLLDSPTPAQALALGSLLIRAGFHGPFRDYREGGVSGREPGWERLDVYTRLRDGLLAEILAHDRRFARQGATEEAAYEARLTTLLKSAGEALEPGEPDFMAVLHRAFGLWGTKPGRTNGVSGIHLGHTIVDERQRVAQDGRVGEIRFIALDNMIHNSFSAWLMDGAGAPGGWAVDGATIVQVRPRYLTIIDGYAALAQPGPARDNAKREAAELRAADRAIAARDPVSFLPGVRARLRLQGIDEVATSAVASTPSAGVGIAFRRAYMDALVASSITAHEGRHVLDQASFPDRCALSNDELEYRAKLSEIRFAPIPKLALSSIYSPLFGGTSGHGIANKRLATDIAAWISAHAGKVSGYQPELTPLEQLDRLTSSQLIEIARALEPPATPCEPDKGK